VFGYSESPQLEHAIRISFKSLISKCIYPTSARRMRLTWRQFQCFFDFGVPNLTVRISIKNNSKFAQFSTSKCHFSHPKFGQECGKIMAVNASKMALNLPIFEVHLGQSLAQDAAPKRPNTDQLQLTNEIGARHLLTTRPSAVTALQNRLLKQVLPNCPVKAT